jgi:hypothetical protein
MSPCRGRHLLHWHRPLGRQGHARDVNLGAWQYGARSIWLFVCLKCQYALADDFER